MDIERQYETIEQLKRSDVKALENWIASQPHLPKTNEAHLILVLFSCEFDLERTKKCLEFYYTIRASYTSVFANRDPELPRIIQGLKSYIFEPFPQLTNDGYGVFYAKLINPAIDNYDFHTQMKLMDMRVHVWLREVGCVKGITFIIDMTGSSIRHLHKLGYFNGRKALSYMLEGLPVRLRAVHIVHPTNFVDAVFTIVHPLISAELRSNLHVHHGDSILDVLPKNCIPNELNGTGGAVDDLHKNFIETIKKNRDYFLEDEQYKADESKRVKQGLLKRFGF